MAYRDAHLFIDGKQDAADGLLLAGQKPSTGPEFDWLLTPVVLTWIERWTRRSTALKHGEI